MKARVFIGSSKEGKRVAEKVKKQLSNDFDCVFWPDLFPLNKGILQTLLQEACGFDFGILVFTKDDRMNSRNRSCFSPRDNVLFEFGLFMGRLGIDKAYMIADSNVKIPTDFSGITYSIFSETETGNALPLEACVGKIADTFKEKAKLAFLGFLPSTALAFGYYKNFVSPMAGALASGNANHGAYKLIFLEEAHFDTENAKFAKLNIVVPNDLDIDGFAQSYCCSQQLKRCALISATHEFHLYMRPLENGTGLLFVDIPRALSNVRPIIQLYLGKSSIGLSSSEKRLETRELFNFKHSLKLLIKGYQRNYVTITECNRKSLAKHLPQA